jgi:hypothetical protein
MTLLSGQCYCGACRYTIDAALRGVSHCHCTMCRRLHGSTFTTWSSVPADKFSLSADEGDLRGFAVSSRTTKYFCARCGTTLYHVTRG